MMGNASSANAMRTVAAQHLSAASMMEHASQTHIANRMPIVPMMKFVRSMSMSALNGVNQASQTAAHLNLSAIPKHSFVATILSVHALKTRSLRITQPKKLRKFQ